MSLFGKLLGSQEIIDAAINTGDKLFHTQEEKAEHYLKVMKMYEAFKVAQRYLALIFCVPYAVAWMMTFIASFWIDITAQSDLLSGTIGHIVLAQIIFYFGGGAITSLKGKK